jgi:hypothetical protein
MTSQYVLHQHRCLTFGCCALGCGDITDSVVARASFEIGPTAVLQPGKSLFLHEFGSFKQKSNI